ncbi:hypothetical protein NC981_19265 [Leptolyngbya sp. DQ-M1]|uniref:hypothetical protein n=1 Tax=Leptolyngbya sp. DQ-M1 TaxID=2933920 RepID=UPI00329A3867
MPESFERQTLKTLVELLASVRDNDQTNFDRVTASIDALTLNIAQLAAQQKQTAANIDKLDGKLDRMITALDGHLALAQQQSANIEALTRLATALVSNNR